MSRTFEIRDAVRESVPMWIGLFGPSGAGKSFSALELATGIQSVTGGDIHAVDTEARRLLHYAGIFKFKHVDFQSPFSPADYLDVARACVKAGAKVVIFDSFSHEWEGVGGVLSMADSSTKGGMSKWIQPKLEHRKMLDGLLQLPCSFIFCFRAREKIKPVKGGDPIELGYQPIAPDDICFEMMLNCFLPPGSNGVPNWMPDFQGERAMVKLPLQFRELFAGGKAPQLNAALGAELARWAAGGETPKPKTAPGFVDLLDGYEDCATAERLEELNAKGKALWSALSKGQRDQVTAALNGAKARLSAKSVQL